MDDNNAVQRDEFLATVAGFFAVLGQVTVTLSAITSVLKESGVATPERWNRHVDAAQLAEHSQKLREVIEQLRGSSVVADLLKDYEGPIQ